MGQRWLWWFAAVGWGLLIYQFSALPVYTGPQTLGLLGRLLPMLPSALLGALNYGVRKSAHLLAFGLLALLLQRAMAPTARANAGAWTLAALYAAFDEWHQSWVPGRSGQVGDVVLDAVGAGLFLLLGSRWQVRRSRRSAAQVPGGLVTTLPEPRTAVDPERRPQRSP